MAHELESLDSTEDDWAKLYRARGDEVEITRPFFTGDVFEKVDVILLGQAKCKNVVILQHPCAMRLDGVSLVPQLLMAEARQHRPLDERQWRRYGKLMPLPSLFTSVDSGRRHQAALFDELYLVDPDKLRDKRVACMSQFGVNVLLQRWVHHNSRVVVPTSTFHEQTGGVYEEADLIEEWCDERVSFGIAVDEAAKECVTWLREPIDGGTLRQSLLDNPQARSAVRKDMRRRLKEFREDKV
ncbi:MAG: hypothetical protein LC776_15755 [Acidobacteria bacterium]|nr:hypothetical protein [Acidobacteriota bacterium]